MPKRLQSAGAGIRRYLQTRRHQSEWSPPHALAWDVILVVAITLVAWWLRARDLATIPPGLHGDEAASGLEARRILDSGWIGVYTGMAGGNPTGFYYLDALVFKFVHDPVLAVRLLSAIGGTTAVPALYVMVRRNIGFGSALVASLLLTFMGWHIQFSRLGFVTGIWPTFVVLGTVALMEAIRSKSWYWWAVAGALLSAGTYIYNGNGPLLAIVGLFSLWYLFGWRAVAITACIVFAALSPSLFSFGLLTIAGILLLASRRFRDKRALVNLASFALASLAVLKEMIDFIRNKPNDYFGRGHNLSVFESDAWKSQQGSLEQMSFLLDRYRDFWDKLTFHPIPDGVDVSGVTAVVPTLTLVICIAGLVIAMLRRPMPLTLLASLVVIAAPLTAVLTDLTLRRALVIAPFLAILGGIGIIEVWRIAFRIGKPAGIMVGIVLIGLMARSNYVNYTDYFDKTVASGPVRHNLGTDLRITAEFMETLSDDAFIYFFCERWVLEYDVVRLIAPDLHGVNRAPKWSGTGTFDVDWSKGAPVFVLMGGYTKDIDTLQALYPGGEVVVGQTLDAPVNGPSFVAYILPDRVRAWSP